MSGLPKGWESTTLSEVLTLKTGPFGSTLHKSDYINGGIPLINPTHIKDGNLVPAVEVSVSDETAQRLSEYRLNEGDVVMGRRGEIGRCAVVPEVAHGWLCGTGSIVLRCSRAISATYLQRFLTESKTVETLMGDSVGSTMVNLNQGVLLGLEVPLAPLPEQKRIADKLDSVLARVDACRERLDGIPTLLKRFRQSVLAAATSGRLTEDWRISTGAAPDAMYPRIKLSSVATSRLGKMLDKAKNTGTPTPYLRNVNVRWYSFDLTDVQMMRIEETERDDLLVMNGDVLICEGGEPGRCAIWKGEDGQVIFQKALHRVRPDPTRLLSDWLVHSLKYSAESRSLDDLFTGTTIKHLTGASLANFVVPLPPLPEQHEIVRRVETLFAFADRLEARCTAARKQVGQLTPALLAKAFRGELVPQDPNDEPAAELLKRLAASRGDAPRARRGRRSPAPDAA